VSPSEISRCFHPRRLASSRKPASFPSTIQLAASRSLPLRVFARTDFPIRFPGTPPIRIDQNARPFCLSPDAFSSENQASFTTSEHQIDRIMSPRREFFSKRLFANRDAPTTYEVGHAAPKIKNQQSPSATRILIRAVQN
jgi:hypothetical protein